MTAPGPGPACRVPLDATGRRWALLREPAGVDERCVHGTTTLDAVRLLDRLLVDHQFAALGPGDAVAATVLERDLLLAAVHCLGWGRHTGGVLTCTACARPFDVDFDLADLADEIRGRVPTDPDRPGTVMLPGGGRFRLPTARDELATAGLPPDEAERALVARCLEDADPDTAGAVVEEAVRDCGIDLDLSAVCPECGADAGFRFAVQEHLLGTIRADWPALIAEVHRIAAGHRWGLDEIMSLPRTDRRAFVALLDGEPLPRVVDPR